LPLRQEAAWHVIVPPVVATVFLILAFGAMHQCFVFVAGRSGTVTWLLCGTILLVLPLMVGRYYQLDFVQALSPSAQFVRWLAYPTETLELTPLLLLYGLLLGVCWFALRRWMRLSEWVVDQKLRHMGVTRSVG